MNIYSREQVASLPKETFAFIEVQDADHVLTITLDRAEKKNAIHPHMLNELAFAMQYAHYQKHVWAIVLQAKGDVFCAGADLKAFMGMVGKFDSSIPKPDGQVLIGEIFNKVHKPTIAKVAGNAYAGGIILLAACNYVVALDSVKLGLPEVKRGLFPFQVMEALLRVMPARKVVDWCIRGYSISAQQAEGHGLVTHLADSTDALTAQVDSLIAELKDNSPSAIRLGLEAFDHIQSSEQQHKYLSKMLQKTIMTKDGQEGLRAFRQKRKPVWTGE